jgi:hypothetical protein
VDGTLSLLDFLSLAPLLLAAGPQPSYEPPPDPGPSPRCPADMRLVSGRHYDEVEHLCTDWRPGPRRCYGYHPEFTITQGPAASLTYCMDQYEAPNQKGKKPLVMRTFPEAAAWCGQHGKRVCAEAEWETACESGDERPWFYGWKLDGAMCNTTKQWRAFDAKALSSGGEIAQKETDRLWQGSPSGDYASCRTRDGIYDLMGNVEEWVVSSRKRSFKAALMGGFWAKPWVGCRGTNDAHEPAQFRFYEVGFRCCKDAAPEPSAPAASSSAGPAASAPSEPPGNAAPR